MADFFSALTDPTFTFLRAALVVGLLASVAFGVLGSFVVVRRITYIADAIAHCVFGGIALALFAQSNLGCRWCHPFAGALASALAAALGIGIVSLYAKQRDDTVISAVWVLGVAFGLLLLGAARNPAGAPPVDPMAYLFGDILLITWQDVRWVAALDGLVLLIVWFFRNKLLAVCFDAEFAELRGVSARYYYLLLLCLVAITVVLLVRVVGAVLVVALLTLPAAVAGFFSRRLWQMMAMAVACCAVLITSGLAVSYVYELRTGPTIVALAGVVYLGLALGSWAWRRR